MINVYELLAICIHGYSHASKYMPSDKPVSVRAGIDVDVSLNLHESFAPAE